MKLLNFSIKIKVEKRGGVSYLPIKNKIIARVTYVILIILSPIFYYKTIDGFLLKIL